MPPKSGFVGQTLSMGVWRVHIIPKSNFLHLTSAQSFIDALPKLARLSREIYAVGSNLSLAYALSVVSLGLNTPVSMFVSGKLMFSLEKLLTSGVERDEMVTLIWFLVAQIGWMLFMAFLGWYRVKTFTRLERRLDSHFELLQLKESINRPLDLDWAETMAHPFQNSKLNVLSTCTGVLGFLTSLVSTVVQLLLSAQIALSLNDHVFVAVSLIGPARYLVTNHMPFGMKYYWVGECQNDAYATQTAMQDISRNATYRSEMRDPLMKKYVLNEYRRAATDLQNQDIDVADPAVQYDHQHTNSLANVLFSCLSSDIPFFYYVCKAVINPADFSMASLSVLQRFSISIEATIRGVTEGILRFDEQLVHLLRLAQLCSSTSPNPVTVDSNSSVAKYKLSGSDLGREIQLKNVSYAYPSGSREALPVLKNINITIEPGQIVALVGKNGSGKSTLVKLLTMEEMPTAGELLVNGLPVESVLSGATAATSVNLRKYAAV